MSEQESWQDNNACYLSTALAWLRLRLEHEANTTPTADISVQNQAMASLDPDATGIVEWRQALSQRRDKPQPLHPGEQVGTSTTFTQQVEASTTHMQLASDLATMEANMEQPPALVALGRRLGLSRFERDVLLLCIAIELDTCITALCARAQKDPHKHYPTFALALTLFENPSWDIVSPERPLRYWRLIEINQPGALPLTVSPLRADEHIVNYVQGLNYLDDRLSPFIVPFEIERANLQGTLPPSQQDLVTQIKLYWRQAWRTATPHTHQPVVQLVGADVQSKQFIANRVATELYRQLYRFPIEMLPTQTTDLELVIRLFERESRLQQLALYLDAQEFDGASANNTQALALRRFLARGDGLFFLSTRETWSHLNRAHLSLDVNKPTTAEQREAWHTALGDEALDSPNQLSGQFDLSLPAIQHIARVALDQTTSDRTGLSDLLWQSCLANVRPNLDMLAQRLEIKMTWDDLVLPDEETRVLHQIADQVAQRNKVYEEWGFSARMNRGMGISALFSGESGTGKTMAAEVITHSLRLNLYRIDLSAVVSKYIGETEKNLRRLFDAAEDGGAILFFDEADALFGKRSEVRDSHDRYANIETNYLLQRMEAYSGLAILATNMKNALDSAFTRRLRFSINFPFPGAPERKRMWQKVFPPNTPTEGLDYERLARFTLTGGSIHNIALNAAFLAAQANTPVTMPTILIATRAEFRKMERPINEAEFRW